MRFMGQQGQHDQIGVQTIHDMSFVGVVTTLAFHGTNVRNDFVFAFPRYFVPTEDDTDVLPQGIFF